MSGTVDYMIAWMFGIYPLPIRTSGSMASKADRDGSTATFLRPEQASPTPEALESIPRRTRGTRALGAPPVLAFTGASVGFFEPAMVTARGARTNTRPCTDGPSGQAAVHGIRGKCHADQGCIIYYIYIYYIYTANLATPDTFMEGVAA